MLEFWETKARKWKKDALAWKAKCKEQDAEKNTSTAKSLKKLFRDDQLALLSGRVKKVRKWANESIVEGLKVHFACGRGYETVRQLPYVALPAYQTLMERIKVVHFDTGKYCVLASGVNGDSFLYRVFLKFVLSLNRFIITLIHHAVAIHSS